MEDLDFADDLALLSLHITDITDRRDKNKKLYEKGRNIRLEINIKKTTIKKIMTRIDGEFLKIKTLRKYLRPIYIFEKFRDQNRRDRRRHKI